MELPAGQNTKLGASTQAAHEQDELSQRLAALRQS